MNYRLALLVLLAVVDARDLNLFSVPSNNDATQDDAASPLEDAYAVRAAGARALQGAPPSHPEEHFSAMKKNPGALKMNIGSHNAAGMKNNQQQQRKLRDPVHDPKPVVIANSNDSEESSTDNSKPGFDFVVAGFPKCGTTTLLKAFAAHEETDMAASEQCAIAAPLQADARVHKLLDGTLETLSSDVNKKRSFKCPTAMYNYKSIARMEKHSPNAKFVIGMRHPVKMLQSFYNYRVTEIKERGLDEPIPTLEQVLQSAEPWKGVSMASTRFELFLMQLGKTDMTAEHLSDLMDQSYDLAVKPTQFKVFLYTVDQLEDADEQRSHTLRAEMQHFLGLTKPIQPFGHENTNHAVGKAAHTESISICDEKWAAVRQQLVEQGAQTAQWLREYLIHSKDVFVGNPEHFVETLESWGTDPCLETTA